MKKLKKNRKDFTFFSVFPSFTYIIIESKQYVHLLLGKQILVHFQGIAPNGIQKARIVSVFFGRTAQ